MARKSSGTRSQLIHCDNCDEEYSATYKRCPFCGARPDKSTFGQGGGHMDLTTRIAGVVGGGGRRTADAGRESTRSQSRVRTREREEVYEDDYVFDGGDVFDDEDGRYDDDEDGYTTRGGKRLAGGSLDISPTTIATVAFSAVLFIAAILIVILVIIPMVRDGSTPPAANNPNDTLPGASSSVSPSPNISPSPLPSVPSGEDPSGPSTSAPVDDPSGPSPTTIPAEQTATGFSINKSEFTISDKYPDPVTIKVTFSPAGTTGTIAWSSSDTSVATVDANGKVTAVGKGTCTITASMPGAADRTCLVRSSVSGGSSRPAASSSPAPSTSAAPSGGSLSLNKSDISITDAYPNPVTLRASGGSGTITWSSSNTAVATVSATGTVTRVSKGTVTITATDSSGASAKCTVRCG